VNGLAPATCILIVRGKSRKSTKFHATGTTITQEEIAALYAHFPHAALARFFARKDGKS
jgi:fructose-1-phosphate kinase PfkB-like protein